MLNAAAPSFPGNKRPSRRAKLLVYTERGTGKKFTAGPKERAACMAASPVWLLCGGLQRDEAFLAGLEAVLDGRETVDSLVGGYQRRGSYGYRVLLGLAEGAIQPAAAKLAAAERSNAHTRLDLRLRLATNGALTCESNAALDAGDRRRARNLAWREQALEALLAMGAGRCLARGCDEPAGRHYCAEHVERKRTLESTPRSEAEEKTAKARHDALVASVADLLREVGRLLGVE
jgi:hypothetical protein